MAQEPQRKYASDEVNEYGEFIKIGISMNYPSIIRCWKNCRHL